MRIKLLLAGVIIVLLGGLIAGIAHAEVFRSGDDVTVARGETLDRTLYAAGRTVDVAGTLNGDLICAGQNINVSGTVTGDVICTGQNVHISGTVGGDVRVAGQSITLGGPVQGSVSAAGQNVTLESGSKIVRDASLAGQTATINGVVGRDLLAGSSTIAIGGTVVRDVQAADTTLSLVKGAHIGGSLTYTSAKLLSRTDGVTIGGRINHQTPPKRGHEPVRVGAFVRGGLLFAFLLLLSMLVTALVLVLLLPHLFHAATEVAMARPLLTLLIGFVTSLVVPFAIVVLLVTVLGIPLAILLLLVWLIVMFMSGPFAAYYLGRLLLGKSEPNAVLIMLLGASVLAVCYFIPFLGALVSLLAYWFGIGIIVLQARLISKPRYNVGRN
jgi:cytoskeletal protein CcmA (bactofilin family)